MGAISDIRRDEFVGGWETFDPSGQGLTGFDYPCMSIHKNMVRIALSMEAMEQVTGIPADEIPQRVPVDLMYSREADAVGIRASRDGAVFATQYENSSGTRNQWSISSVGFAKRYGLSTRFPRARRYHLVNFGKGTWGARLDNEEEE